MIKERKESKRERETNKREVYGEIKTESHKGDGNRIRGLKSFSKCLKSGKLDGEWEEPGNGKTLKVKLKTS